MQPSQRKQDNEGIHRLAKEQILMDRPHTSGLHNLTKIRLPLKPGEWEDLEAENVWAEVVRPSEYRIANVPFYAYGISAEDIVHAARLNGILTFTGISQRGGHSTYRLLLRHGASIEDPQFLRHWKPLEHIGATFELAKKSWLAVDIPPTADIH